MSFFKEIYECLFFRQYGGEGFQKVKHNLIPQRFNIYLWTSQKFSEKDLATKSAEQIVTGFKRKKIQR